MKITNIFHCLLQQCPSGQEQFQFSPVGKVVEVLKCTISITNLQLRIEKIPLNNFLLFTYSSDFKVSMLFLQQNIFDQAMSQKTNVKKLLQISSFLHLHQIPSLTIIKASEKCDSRTKKIYDNH